MTAISLVQTQNPASFIFFENSALYSHILAHAAFYQIASVLIVGVGVYIAYKSARSSWSQLKELSLFTLDLTTFLKNTYNFINRYFYYLIPAININTATTIELSISSVFIISGAILSIISSIILPLAPGVFISSAGLFILGKTLPIIL